MLELLFYYLLTVAALAGTFLSGRARRRRLHFVLIGAMVVFLAQTIRVAEQMGRGLLFEGPAAIAMWIHFILVAAAFALLAVMLFTGLRILRVPASGARRVHSRMARGFIASVLGATAFGFLMVGLAKGG